MAGMTVTIEGTNKIKDKLFNGAVLTRPVRTLFHEAALEVERRAKINATRRPGPRVQTGRLRSSITSTVQARPIPLWAKVSTNVEYASHVEFGHSQRPGRYVPAIGARLVQDFAPAYPFLFPAFEAAKPKIDHLMAVAAKMIEEDFGK